MESSLPPSNIRLLTKESIAKSDSEEDDINKEYKKPIEKLKEGQYLPRNLCTDFNPDFSYVPLEDFDPFYSNQQTFTVLGYKQLIYRFNARHSFFSFSPFNPLRRFATYLLTHWIFCAFIFTIVVINSIVLVKPFYPPLLSTIAEFIFISIYVFELVLKFIGRGFLMGKFTALRSIWTWLDIAIITLGIVALATQSEKVSGLAAIRILKVIPLVPDLRQSFDFVVDIIKSLSEVFCYALVAILGTSIFAMHLYSGTLLQKCIKNTTMNDNWRSGALWDSRYDDYQLCGNQTGSRKCEEGYICLNEYGSNPNSGYTSFDQLPVALLNTLRVICQDALETLYRQMLETSGNAPRYFDLFPGLFFLATTGIFCFTMTVIAKSMLDKTDEEPLAPNPTVEIEGVTCISEDDAADNIPELPDEPNPCIQVCCAWSCCSCCDKFRNRLNKILKHPAAEFFMLVIIILDICGLAMYHYGVEKMKTKAFILWWIELVFLGTYIKECVFKLIALSPMTYFQKGWNVFDFIIAVLSILYVCLQSDLLHTILLIRVLKLLPRWNPGTWILSILSNTLTKFGNIFILMILHIYVFSLIGASLFKDDYLGNTASFRGKELPQWNFTDIWHSALLIFRILCGEWIASLWDCMMVSSESCRLFFFFVVIIGNLLLGILCTAVAFTTFGALKFTDSVEAQAQPGRLDGALMRLVENFKSYLERLKTKGKTSPETEVIGINEGPGSNDGCSDTRTASAADVKKSDSKENCTSWWANFRQSTLYVTESKYFYGQAVVVIAISSVTLALDEHNRESWVTDMMNIGDVAFTVYTLVGLLLKLIAVGFFRSFTSPAWIFDFFIVLEMILNLSFYFPYGDLFQSRGCFCIRCLRPLMLISRMHLLQVVAEGILKEVKFILDFLQVGTYVWLIFGILGLHFFNGRFMKCVTTSNGKVVNYGMVQNLDECDQFSNMTWHNPDLNFDRIDKSFVSLTHLATFNEWTDIVRSGVDLSGKKIQPYRDANCMAYFYFIAFIVIGVFFIFTVIFGAVTYYLYREKYSIIFMSNGQLKTYIEDSGKFYRKNSYTISVPKPILRPVEVVYDIVTSNAFDLVIMSCIMADIFALALNDYNASSTMKSVLYWNFFALSLVFVAEFLVKLIALRQYYFINPWNLMDLIIMINGIVGLLIPSRLGYAMATRAIRIFRIFQLQPLLRYLKRLRCFLTAIYMSRATLFNLMLFLFIIMYTYSVLGMAFFKNVKLNSGLNDVINFQTFWNSFLLLVQVSSFAGWSGIFTAITNEYDCFIENVETGRATNCGHQTDGKMYMYSFLTISFMIFMNMYSVLILETLAQMLKLDEVKPTQEEQQDEMDSDEEGDPIPSGSASVHEFPQEVLEEEPESKNDAQTIFERPDEPDSSGDVEEESPPLEEVATN